MLQEKFLKLKEIKTFAVCPKCNKLHNAEDNGQSVLKCDHVEFSNHSKRNQHEACEVEITLTHLNIYVP